LAKRRRAEDCQPYPLGVFAPLAFALKPLELKALIRVNPCESVVKTPSFCAFWRRIKCLSVCIRVVYMFRSKNEQKLKNKLTRRQNSVKSSGNQVEECKDLEHLMTLFQGGTAHPRTRAIVRGIPLTRRSLARPRCRASGLDCADKSPLSKRGHVCALQTSAINSQPPTLDLLMDNASRTPQLEEYTAAQAGQTATSWLRWVSTRGEERPACGAEAGQRLMERTGQCHHSGMKFKMKSQIAKAIAGLR
jgi:hypothetical protein